MTPPGIIDDSSEYEAATLEFFAFLAKVLLAVVMAALSIVWFVWEMTK